MKTFFFLSLLSALGLIQAQPGRADAQDNLSTAYFAGGCFWCIEAKFEKIPGVQEAISGYSGGHVQNPSYEQVCSGSTGHREAVQVIYHPGQVSYQQLLQAFWQMFDPTDAGGSFADRGPQYTSAIFYQSPEEKQIAEASKQELQSSGRFRSPVATSIEPFRNFFPAEEKHQNYYRKKPGQYNSYSSLSGREKFITKHWGQSMQLQPDANPDSWSEFDKPNAETLRQELDPMQFKVTQEQGTEPAFKNEYWDNKQQGIYVDLVSGEPLFSSRDKFDSGTGWPSFTRPLEPEHIVTREDRFLGLGRTEVRSRYADSHLGHVFTDGPEPTGLRYCINSAALRFIPRQELQQKGYGQYLEHFQDHERSSR
jgi:peptide methionine sulfoxide reductase msrA/msrB